MDTAEASIASEVTRLYAKHPLMDPQDRRVLDIEPADDLDAPLVMSLRVIRLANYPEDTEMYQCLSYAWGPRDFGECIACDDCEIPVTKTLYAALKRIRQQSALGERFSLTLWVDYLCIAQHDDAEKNSQVALMGRVYSEAQRLIIWLGNASGEQVSNLQASLRRKDLPPTRRKILLAFAQLEWFQRRWVLQEVIRSKKNERYMLYGDFCFPPRALFNAYGSISASDMDFADALGVHPFLTVHLRDAEIGKLGLKHSKIRRDPFRETLASGPPTLLTNMFAFRQMRCENPLDRLYALFGISGNKDPVLEAKIDYTLGVRQLYVMSARKWLVRAPELLLISATLFEPGQVSKEGEAEQTWPSWVPRWHEPLRSLSLGERWLLNYMEDPTEHSFRDERERYIVDGDDVLAVSAWCLCVRRSHKEHTSTSEATDLEKLLPQRCGCGGDDHYLRVSGTEAEEELTVIYPALEANEVVLALPQYIEGPGPRRIVSFIVRRTGDHKSIPCFQLRHCFDVGAVSWERCVSGLTEDDRRDQEIVTLRSLASSEAPRLDKLPPAKTYNLGRRDREMVDRMCDGLQEQGKLGYIELPTPFAFSVPVPWSKVPIPAIEGQMIDKACAKVDIQGLNDIAILDGFQLQLAD